MNSKNYGAYANGKRMQEMPNLVDVLSKLTPEELAKNLSIKELEDFQEIIRKAMLVKAREETEKLLKKRLNNKKNLKLSQAKIAIEEQCT